MKIDMSVEMQKPLVSSAIKEPDPTIEVVIAHYNEDLSWLETEIKHCTIYSKGGEKNAPSYPHTTLPNIGREGHTYLHHLIHRYDSLADITIFLQGRIDDHCTMDIGAIIDAARTTKDGQVTTFPFRELELFDLWDGIPWEEYPVWKKWSSMNVLKAERTPAQHFERLFPRQPTPAFVGFHPGALFAVTRKTIQQHPQTLYQSLMEDCFQGNMAHIDPETGHFMERFWLAMWNPTEYICWDEKDVAQEERNAQGQLAKGRWHRTPRNVELDKATLPPSPVLQLPTPPSSGQASGDTSGQISPL